jgi:hypothetical protein
MTRHFLRNSLGDIFDSQQFKGRYRSETLSKYPNRTRNVRRVKYLRRVRVTFVLLIKRK